MAIRLSQAFRTSAESWFDQQMQNDLWKARLKIKKVKIPPVAA